MDVSNPFQSLMPGATTDVMIVLARSSALRNSNEVARLSGRSRPSVMRILNRLADDGLVLRERVGATIAFRMNRDHLAAGAVQDLVSLRRRFFQELRRLVAGWERQPAHASVFGSMARGDGTSSSDIDVLVVRPGGLSDDDHTWSAQVDEMIARIEGWTGNSASVADLSITELSDGRDRPVFQEIIEDGVHVAGQPLSRVTSGDDGREADSDQPM